MAQFSPLRGAFHVLAHLVLSTIAVLVAQKIVPGVYLDGWMTAMTVAIVLGIINFTLRPVLSILTLPINILTLGLFTFILNAFMLLLVDTIVPGFTLASFWTALLCSVVLSLINWLFSILAK